MEMQRFAITDRRMGAAPHALDEAAMCERLIARAAALAAEGIDYLLIREKDLSGGGLTTLGRRVVEAVRRSGFSTKILVSGRADVALAIGADGVHLSSAAGELTPPQVRALMSKAFVSVSCHSLEEVRRACERGASAVLFGPVFGKTVEGVEVVSGVGLEALQRACNLAGETPVFALGGVTESNTAACQSAGARGIAGIRLFFGSAGAGLQLPP